MNTTTPLSIDIAVAMRWTGHRNACLILRDDRDLQKERTDLNDYS